jgi:hypothetical protein
VFAPGLGMMTRAMTEAPIEAERARMLTDE